MARLGKPIKLVPETGDWMADMREEDAAFRRLMDAEATLGPDEVTGVLLRYGRGDGEAVYLVTKASPLTVSLLVFGDCWTVEDALIRGLTKADVLAAKRRNATLASLFGRRPA